MSSEQGVSMFVLFTDISKWSTCDAFIQKAEIVALSRAANEVFSAHDITLRWRIGTGDGFAVAFQTSSHLAIQTACSLLEKVQEQGGFEIRMSLAEGSVMFYENPLMSTEAAKKQNILRLFRKKRLINEDIVGLAAIVARRLLNGAAPGSFLIKEHVATDAIGSRSFWKNRLVKHSSVVDKHHECHPVYRYVPQSETQSHVDFHKTPEIHVELMTIVKRLGAEPNQAIQDIAKARNTSLQAIGGLILLWLDAKCDGLQPDVATVVPERGQEKTNNWTQSLKPLPNKIRNYSAGY